MSQEIEVNVDPPRASFRRIGCGIVAMLLLVVVPGGVLTALRFWKQETRKNGLVSVAVPDGGRIIVDDVVFGRSHKYIFRRDSLVRIPFIGQFGETEISSHRSSPADRYLIFFRRVDAEGRPMQLNWWGGCRIHDAQGGTHREAEAVRIAATKAGSISTTGGSLPFRDTDQDYDFIIGEVEMPAVPISSEHPTLDFLDDKRNVMATVELPFPAQPIKSTWVPEPLPIRREVAGVEVILDSLATKVYHSDGSSGRDTWYSLDRHWTLRENGQPTTAWKVDRELASDEAGESGMPPLSRYARAWKLSAVLAPTDPAQTTNFSDDPVNRVPSAHTFQKVAIPANDTSVETGESVGLAPEVQPRMDLKLVLGRVGRGASEWGEPGARAGRHHGYSSRNQLGEFYVSVTSNGNAYSVSMQKAKTWIQFRHRPLEGTERLEFKVVDDQDREVPLYKYSTGPEFTYLHLDPAPEAVSLEVTVYALTLHPFELFVAPPPVPKE